LANVLTKKPNDTKIPTEYNSINLNNYTQ